MMKNTYKFAALFISLFLFACEGDQDLISPNLDVIKKVKSTEILLRDHTWGFNDFIVNVQYEMPAIFLLANIADENGMVQPGTYNSYDIFGNDHRQTFHTFQFTTANINRDTTGSDDYHQIGFYNVLSSKQIRISSDNTGFVTYNYRYSEEEGIFTMTSGNLAFKNLNEALNERIADAVYTGKPNDIANAVVDKIFGNEQLQDSIRQVLYDAIHGKIDELAENPEKLAEKLAKIVVEKLKEVDWEALVHDKVLELLEELQVENPEERAQELASQIADRIETNISQSDIYEAILPILQEFENETLPTLVPVIVEAIYGVIANAFSEENIYDKIYPIWTAFSQVDSTTISEVADTLGSVFTNHFFDEENLTNSLVPFMQTLRTTSTIKIGALAQDIIDNELIPLVDSLYATFPKLDLDPDWNSVKPILTSALTLIKSSLNDQTNEEAAANLAQALIGIMDSIITKGVESAIFRLQGIPADEASLVIAAWVSNLVQVAEPEIVEFLEGKLTELADLFNAEEVAEKLSALIHEKILEVFGAENLYDLIYPIMENLSQINIEAAAQKITDWLFELGIIRENITEEQIVEALTEKISELIGNIDVDEVTQKVVDIILESSIVENIDGSVLKQLLEIKIYEFLIDLGQYLNAIDKVEISIITKN